MFLSSCFTENGDSESTHEIDSEYIEDLENRIGNLERSNSDLEDQIEALESEKEDLESRIEEISYDDEDW